MPSLVHITEGSTPARIVHTSMTCGPSKDMWLCHLKCYASEEWVRHANSVAWLRVMVSPSSVSKNALGRSSWELNLDGDNPDATRWGATESQRYFSLSASVQPKSSSYRLEDQLADVPLTEPPAPVPAMAKADYKPIILDEESWIQHTTEADSHAETLPQGPMSSATLEPDVTQDIFVTQDAPGMGQPQWLGRAAPDEVPDVTQDQSSMTLDAPGMGQLQWSGSASPYVRSWIWRRTRALWCRMPLGWANLNGRVAQPLMRSQMWRRTRAPWCRIPLGWANLNGRVAQPLMWGPGYDAGPGLRDAGCPMEWANLNSWVAQLLMRFQMWRRTRAPWRRMPLRWPNFNSWVAQLLMRFRMWCRTTALWRRMPLG